MNLKKNTHNIWSYVKKDYFENQVTISFVCNLKKKPNIVKLNYEYTFSKNLWRRLCGCENWWLHMTQNNTLWYIKYETKALQNNSWS